MKDIILTLLFSLCVSTIGAVSEDYFFFVSFNDKNNTKYSLNVPSDYLSERAIARRLYYGVAVDSTDLPVNEEYILAVQSVGVSVHCRTKWLNGITINSPDSSVIDKIKALPMVKKVEYTGKKKREVEAIFSKKLYSPPSYDYGKAEAQIAQLGLGTLHHQGYVGNGIQIAVIDAGFQNVNDNPAFETLRSENRLLGTMNFTTKNRGSDVFTLDHHGAYVLSAIVGSVDEEYVATAPNASVWLIVSEYVAQEYPYELDFWVSAVEFADSVGVDICTTSLGYTEFDDARLNYTCEQLDGKTIRGSRAAQMANDKALLVINAAGNEGNTKWHYISAPADAEGVITVGAIDKDGTIASFSSYGPSSDERVKPEILARGKGSVLLDTYGNVFSGNGTSYACPIIAGATACLLEGVKQRNTPISLMTMKRRLYESADHYTKPTPQGGYGIPNYGKVLESLLSFDVKREFVENRCYYAPTTKNIIVESDKNERISIEIHSSQGVPIRYVEMAPPRIAIPVGNLPHGVYLVRGIEIETARCLFRKKIVL